MVSSCKHGNEPSGFVKGGKFRDELSTCKLVTDFDPSSLLFMTHFARYRCSSCSFFDSAVSCAIHCSNC
jgi:hypothetical protein